MVRMASSTETLPLPPLTCRDFTSWHLSGTRSIGVYLAVDGMWEVWQVGFRFEERHGVHLSRAEAEVEAAALAVLLGSEVTA